MTDDELRPVLDELEAYEGRVPWMYLDTAGNVTVGAGCLLASVDAACALPFVGMDGTPATADMIAAEFCRLKSMPAGLRAGAYQGKVRLVDTDIDALAFSRLRTVVSDIPAVFPGFDGFPLGVRPALLDLAWNCGLGEAPGLRGWAKLRAACNSVPPDWATAARECTTANPNNSATREARNAWRARMFVEAAQSA